MRRLFLAMVAGLVIGQLTTTMAAAVPAPTPEEVSFNPITQPTTVWPGGRNNRWNLRACELVVEYELHMGQYVPPLGNSQWTSIGVSNGTTFRGWMSSGAPFAAEALPGTLDLDDKWNLGAPDRFDERSYDVEPSADPTGPGVIVPTPIGNPSANYGVWFDRTGVDPFQAQFWGAVDGATYNTRGNYVVKITFRALAANVGTMFAQVNGIQTGFYDGSWRNAEPDYPWVGKSFTANLANLRVFGKVTASGVQVDNWRARGCH